MSASFDEQLTSGFTPRNNQPYTDKAYWNYRFEREASYEWLADYSTIAPLVHKHLKREYRILMLGVGNSGTSAEMYADGYHKLTNTDYSDVVIARMAEKHKDLDMSWEVMDMRDLKYPDATFDAVFDKAAMDAILAHRGEGKWDPPADLVKDIDQVCHHVRRVLRPGGIYIQLSFGQPHFRRLYLDKPEFCWTFDVEEVDAGFGYFLYVMRIPETAEEEEAIRAKHAAQALAAAEAARAEAARAAADDESSSDDEFGARLVVDS